MHTNFNSNRVCINRNKAFPKGTMTVCLLQLTIFRVMKQTLRSSGANVTATHIEDVSLSALFLLEAAKKTDRQFGVTPQTRRHTIRDSVKDIQKVVLHLIENTVTAEMPDREKPKFNHPTEKGWKKLSSSGWLEGILSSSLVQELETETERGEVDLDYELYDVM